MTVEEMNEEIATTVMGWHLIHGYWFNADGFDMGYGCAVKDDDIPRFNPMGDMNDAYLVEERLTGLGLQASYSEALELIVLRDMPKGEHLRRAVLFYAIAHARPEQRCEAARNTIRAFPRKESQ